MTAQDELLFGLEGLGMRFLGVQMAAEAAVSDLLKVHRTATSFGWHDHAAAVNSPRVNAWQVHGAATEAIDTVNQILAILRPLPGWTRPRKRRRDLDRALSLLAGVDAVILTAEQALTRGRAAASEIALPGMPQAFATIQDRELRLVREHHRLMHRRLWLYRWHRHHLAVVVTATAISAWFVGAVVLRAQARYLYAGAAAGFLRAGWLMVQDGRQSATEPLRPRRASGADARDGRPNGTGAGPQAGAGPG